MSMNSSNARVKVARRHRRPQDYTELDSDVNGHSKTQGQDCNLFITCYIIYYACICPTFTGICMTRLMLTYLPCFLSCLLLCTMFHVFLYIHYVHIYVLSRLLLVFMFMLMFILMFHVLYFVHVTPCVSTTQLRSYRSRTRLSVDLVLYYGPTAIQVMLLELTGAPGLRWSFVGPMPPSGTIMSCMFMLSLRPCLIVNLREYS